MSRSSEETALLKAIVAEWDNDVPRLVYADWLEENDRYPRAQFIRLQCQLHQALRNNDPDTLSYRSRLIDNLQDLMNGYSSIELFGESPKARDCFTTDPEIRGFPERLELTIGINFEEDPIEFAIRSAPAVRQITLTVDDHHCLPRFLASGLVSFCTVLQIRLPYDDMNHQEHLTRIQELTQMDWPASLRELQLPYFPSGSSGRSMLEEMKRKPAAAWPVMVLFTQTVVDYERLALYEQFSEFFGERVRISFEI